VILDRGVWLEDSAVRETTQEGVEIFADLLAKQRYSHRRHRRLRLRQAQPFASKIPNLLAVMQSDSGVADRIVLEGFGVVPTQLIHSLDCTGRQFNLRLVQHLAERRQALFACRGQEQRVGEADRHLDLDRPQTQESRYGVRCRRISVTDRVEFLLECWKIIEFAQVSPAEVGDHLDS
jgi:hypothetical protein